MKTNLGIIETSLHATTLEKILQLIWHKQISLNSEKIEGLGTLGIRVMIDEV